MISREPLRPINQKLDLKRVLVIVMPGIGDTLLATPLVRSLKQSYPEARIDMLVRPCAVAMLKDNPLVEDILTYDRNNIVMGYLGPIAQILRRYDLAVSTKSSDRCCVLALFAAPFRAAIVPRSITIKNFWKRITNQVFVEESESEHTLLQNVKLAAALGLEQNFEVVLPTADEELSNLSEYLPKNWKERSFVLVHLIPGPAHKWWPLDKWKDLIKGLTDRGVDVILSGGPEDQILVDKVAREFPSGVYSLAGRASLADFCSIARYARAYVGPDTSTTHLAAATGVPTLALFGPILPSVWGPWPRDYRQAHTPFRDEPGVQTVGNVTVLRANCRCHPFKRSCRQHQRRESLCMEELSTSSVLEVLDSLLKDKESR